ncbi:MAG: hypothetical protein MUO58_18510 [Anaerolineales bacterium]|nr:hypothetical protein [Anaerolineales bacterium]
MSYIHSPSPAIPLANLFNMDKPSDLVLVNGVTGSGTSAWWEKAALRYQEAGP